MYYRNTSVPKQYIKNEFLKDTSKKLKANLEGATSLTKNGVASNILGNKKKVSMLGRKKSQNNFGLHKKSAIQKVKEKSKNALKSATKKAAKKVSPREMIKNLAKVARLQDLINSKDTAIHSDLMKGIGKKGVQLAVNSVIVLVKAVIKATMKVLGTIASFLGVYILGAVSVVVIIACMIGGTSSSSDSAEIGNTEIVASQLSEPRLNADGMLTNAWYVGDINPFVPAGYGVVRYGRDTYGNTVTYYGNCTAYAWGRWGEILGYAPSLPTGNAGTWYDVNVRNGTYEYGQTAKAGAIAVWQYSNGGPGHVAVVEQILSNGTIVMSESQFNGGTRRDIGNLFYTRTFLNEQAVHNQWIFKGYIYLPVDMEE